MWADVLGKRWLFCILCTMYLQDTAKGNSVIDALFDSVASNAGPLVTATDLGSTTISDESQQLISEVINPPSLSDEMAVMKKLKDDLNITPDILFSINNRKDIDKMAMLPHFGPWLENTISINHEEMNPARAYGLLVNVSSLLEIAYAGCYHFDCLSEVLKIQRDYQAFIYTATDTSYDGINKAISVMKYIKAAVKTSVKDEQGRKTAVTLLKRVVPKVQSIVTHYETLEKETVKLKDKAEETMYSAIAKKLALKKKLRKWAQEDIQIQATKEATNKQLILLKNLHARTMNKIKKIEKRRNENAVEFIKFLRTDVQNKECDTAMPQRYKKVINTVKTTVAVRESCGYFKEISKCPKDEPKKKFIHLDDSISKHCWNKKDEVHLKELNSKMDAINADIKMTRPAYLTLLKKLHEIQKEIRGMTGLIAASIVRENQFNDTSKNKENALDGLERVRNALALVETIFKQAKYFWTYQKSFVERAIKEPIKETTELDSGMTYGIDDETPKERKERLNYRYKAWSNGIVRIGMNWLVFGRLASIGYVTLDKGKKSANRAYISEYDEAARSRILGKGRDVVANILEFVDKINTAEEISIAQRTEAYKFIVSRFNVIKPNPDVKPTDIVLTTVDQSGISTEEPW